MPETEASRNSDHLQHDHPPGPVGHRLTPWGLSCTCHPGDDPPTPCPGLGALTACRIAAATQLMLLNADGDVISLADAQDAVIRYGAARYPNRSELARRLGIGRTKLYRELRRLGIPHHHQGDTTP